MSKTLLAEIESSPWGCAQVCNLQKSCKSWIYQTDSSPAICITSYLSAAELVAKGCAKHQGTVIPQIISQELDQCLDEKYVNLPEMCKVNYHLSCSSTFYLKNIAEISKTLIYMCRGEIVITCHKVK